MWQWDPLGGHREEAGFGAESRPWRGAEASDRGFDGSTWANSSVPAVGSRGFGEEAGYVQGHDLVWKAEGLNVSLLAQYTRSRRRRKKIICFGF